MYTNRYRTSTFCRSFLSIPCFADDEFADEAEEEELVEAQTEPDPKKSEPKPQGRTRSFTTKPVIPKPVRK